MLQFNNITCEMDLVEVYSLDLDLGCVVKAVTCIN